jgi:hypothetical protein
MKKQYKSYAQTQEFLKECVLKHPEIIQIESIGKTWEDRKIMLAKVSLHVKSADLKPALLYTGTIHAREWIGNELAISFIEYLLENYQTNPQILEAITKNCLYIVPCLNPDGFEYSRKYFSFWRKNRRNNADGTYGVDLNRNFSVGFHKTNETSSNVYSGPFAFSEPETKAIKAFVDSHTNITIALDYHSQGNVFFPTHKFNHEAEIEGTDHNTLCANMNYCIQKVTGRKYGIHRGKPPKALISGSGREYYYDRGIIASVVEVGTRNIPDFMQNMRESIHENFPALLYALSEAKNYSKEAPKRPQCFLAQEVSSQEALLKWDYESKEDIYFEIYRNRENKEACNENSLIGVTKNNHFLDVELQSGTQYFYYIRAVDNKTKIKSPFAPKTRIQTMLDRTEFFRSIFPAPNDIGYVAELTKEQNRAHFGKNSLFVGVDENRGVSYGVIDFKLDTLPKEAHILEAKLSLYPLDRVNAKIEKFGEWGVCFVDQKSIAQKSDYEQIHNAQILQTIGVTIPSENLTQGIWSYWDFSAYERHLLEIELQTNQSVLFRIGGPTKLPLGRDSQMMMFDLGYGGFGGGIHYRPSLFIKYTLPNQKLQIKASRIATISSKGVDEKRLSCGFDKENSKIYGYMEFDLKDLPAPEHTVITNAYITIKSTSRTDSNEDIRYNVEFVDISEPTCKTLKERERIEFIGYEVSRADLQKNRDNHFIFDSYSKLALEDMHQRGEKSQFVIKPTSSIIKNHLVTWKEDVSLNIEYIKRRVNPPLAPTDLKIFSEGGKVKLVWTNPTNDGFVGVYVVRNCFHTPTSPFDGDKLYAGKDNYTYDSFGNEKVPKYFAIFSYDDVPNYSAPLKGEWNI